MRPWILAMLMCFFSLPVLAKANPSHYHHQHSQGWHWYRDPPPEKNKKEVEASPSIQMQALRTALTQSMEKAILNPSSDNVRNYLALQQSFSQRASRFANTWQQVLLENPSLNYSLTQPVNATGNQVYLALKREQEDAAIAQIAKRQGLFFFYTRDCPYCKKFAPILKAFADKHRIAVIAITLDGGVLPEFPQSVTDNGQARYFDVKVTPAVFTVNPYSRKAYPISYGLVAESELRTNLLNIATQFGKNEK